MKYPQLTDKTEERLRERFIRPTQYMPDMSRIEEFFCLNFDTVMIRLYIVYPGGFGKIWHGFVDEFVQIADMFWEEEC